MGANRHLVGTNCLELIDLGAEQLVTVAVVTNFVLPQPHPPTSLLNVHYSLENVKCRPNINRERGNAWPFTVCTIAYHSFHQVNVIINTTIFLHFTHVRPFGVSGHKYCSLTFRLTNNNMPVHFLKSFSLELIWREMIMNFTLTKIFPSIKISRLQNSRFRTFSEGGKRRKSDPRVWSTRASHALRACDFLPRRFFTRSRPFVRIWSVALIRKKYGCFAF